jgi:hypothetical protein
MAPALSASPLRHTLLVMSRYDLPKGLTMEPFRCSRVLSLIDNGSPGGAELRSTAVEVHGDNWVQQQQNATVMTWRAWSTVVIKGRTFLRHGYPPKPASPWHLKKIENADLSRWIVTYSERTFLAMIAVEVYSVNNCPGNREASRELSRVGSYDVEIVPLPKA